MSKEGVGFMPKYWLQVLTCTVLIWAAAASGAFSQVIFVNGATGNDASTGSSWGQAYKTVTRALTAASAGREIWVAKGVYSPGTTTASTFTLKSGVKIYGGFSGSESSLAQRDISKLHTDNETILDGGNINYHVVYNNGTLAATTVLDGFTIRGGRTAAGTSVSANYVGAGIYNAAGGSATFSNLVIKNNSAFAGAAVYNLGAAVFDNIVMNDNTVTGDGGAIYNGSPSAAFSRLTLSQNSAARNGGAIYTSGASFAAISVTGNSAFSGGGIYNSGGNLSITDAVISQNAATAATGGGMHLANGIVTLDRVSLIANTSASQGAGAYVFGATLTLSNSFFSRNRVTGTGAVFGGGIYFYTGGPHKVVNTTFSNNSTSYVHASTSTGAGIYRNVGTVNVYNSIFWGNKRGGNVPDQINATTGVNVVRGIVEGGFSGAMDLDPKFTDAAADDLRPVSGSPAIDAGDASVLDADDLDVAKSTRIVNSLIDLGAYEHPTGADIRIQNGLAATLVRGQPVNTTQSATGGNGSYTWSVASGQMPGGLSLSPTGVITGSPFGTGSYSVVIRVTDGSLTGYRWYTGTITDAPARVYVRAAAAGTNSGSSWTDAFNSLQDALPLVKSGDEIWVARGTYSPGTTTSDRFTLVAGVKIYGGFAGTEAAVDDRDLSQIHSGNAAVLDGGNTNYHVVYNAAALTNTTVLDGFVITRGNAAGGASQNGYGGGVYNSAGSPVFRNLLITGNQAYNGGGMYNTGTPLVDKVVFRTNSVAAYGGGLWTSTATTLTDVQFVDNTAAFRGGGMYNSSASILNRVSFVNNTSVQFGGGFNNEGGAPKLDNVVFSRNKVTGTNGNGGGFYSSGGTPVITNATFSNNTTAYVHATTLSGAGAFAASGTLTIHNSIMWGNRRGNNVPDQLNASVVVTNSIVEGGHSGTRILLGDPLFVDASADDLRLTGGSLAIDAGDNARTSSTTDIAGSPRVVNTVDLGAYETAVNTGLTITTGDFTAMPRGTPHQTDLVASGSTGPYTWSVSAGNLPPGLSLSATGRLSGVPMLAGSYDFVASVSDGTLVGNRQYTLSVSPATVRLYIDQSATGSNSGSSWTNAMTDLQSAFAIASAGDELWVAKGTYSAGGTAASTFSLRSAVKIYGGFSGTEAELTDRVAGKLHTDNETILTGNDISEHVITASGTLTSETVLDGFTVTGGKANLYGGGIYISSAMVSAQFQNLVIRGNTAEVRGGGVYNTGTTTFSDVQITGNSANYGGGLHNTAGMIMRRGLIDNNTAQSAGGGIDNTGNAVLTDVKVSNNRTTFGLGGGMNSTGSPQLTNVSFESNSSATQGGGLALAGTSPVLTNVKFLGNTSVEHGGGLYSWPSSGTLTNIVFSGNRVTGTTTSSFGGGMYHHGGSSMVVNATFSQNTTANAAASGAGLYMRNSGSLSVYNSIFWGNRRGGNVADQISPNPAANLTINKSIVEGDYSNGTDILIGDPLFENPATHNLRLKGGSAAIDAGINLRNNSPVDVAGDPRVYNSTIDLGAYENQGSLSITVDPHTFPVAVRGTPLSELLTATGGTGSYTWTLSSGSIPNGLTFTPQGELKGIPFSTGSFDFAVSVTDGTLTGGRQFTLQVDAGPARFHVTEASGGTKTGADWANAFTSIGDAMAQALLGDEVWVAKGTYSPGNTTASSFSLKEGVKLYGGFAGTETALIQRNAASIGTVNETILTGGDVSYHVVFNNSALTNATLLDGFSITRGKTQSCCTPNIHYYGGGIYNAAAVAAVFRNLQIKNNSGQSGAGVYNLGPAVFENVSFSDNIAATDGGGMYNTGAVTLSNISFVRNTSSRHGGALWNSGIADFLQLNFIDNSASQNGGALYNSATSDLTNGLFRNNRAANGAGLYSSGAVTMSDVSFEDNKAVVNGGGIWTSAGLNLARTQFRNNEASGSGGAFYNSGASVLDRVSFVANSAVNHGGAFYNSGTATRITNSVFSRNRVTSSLANYGAGIYNYSGTLTTNNNSFSQNSIAYTTADAAGSGAALHMRSGTVNAYNSIFWGNTRGGGMPDQLNAGISLVNGVVQGGYPSGFGVMIGDPAFANAGLDDLTLTVGSSAIDRGDDNKNSTLLDFSGDPRVNGVIDIGADEYAGPAALTISHDTMTSFTRGIAPSINFTASGGNGTYTWNVTSGSLPPGISLTTAGTLQGTPMVQGSYTFVVSATDGTITGSKQFTVAVNPGAARLHVSSSAAGMNNGSSWSNAFTDMQAAIAVSVGGDEIWVARGIYSPGALSSSTFTLKEGVKWYGGFAGTETSLAQRDTSRIRTDYETVLDGSQGTPSYHVVSNAAPLTSATVLDGFTISGGRTLVDGGDYTQPAYVGAGLYNDHTASALTVANVVFKNNRATNGAAIYNAGPATFSNVKITVNQADYRGGGIYNTGTATFSDMVITGNSAQLGAGVYTTGSGTLKNSTVAGNNAFLSGGGIYATGDPFTITDVSVSGNIANSHGGGLYLERGDHNLEGVNFNGNTASKSGGAVYLNGGGPDFSRIRFSGNSAGQHGGAFYNQAGYVYILNSLFISNSVTVSAAFFGGGLYSYGGSVFLTNTTFSLNRIGYSGTVPNRYGGAVYRNGGSIEIRNSIFWKNERGGGVADQLNPGISVANSIVEDGYTGTAIFNADPGFEDPAAGKFELLNGSVAVNAGDNSKNVRPKDLNGGQRIFGDIIDLGAFEKQSAEPVSITPETLDPVARGTTVSIPLSASGGTPPYNWSVLAGQLPPGLELTSTGELKGVATLEGTYEVFVSAKDAAFNGSRRYLITVTPGPARFYVNKLAAGQNTGADWTNAFTDLQTALSRSVSGDEIWVAKGTYSPGLQATSTFTLKEGVKLYGGFAGTEDELTDRDLSLIRTVNETTLNGAEGVASYHVVFNAAALTNQTVLDGFTISGGRTVMNGSNSLSQNYVGAGLYNGHASGAPVLRNLVFSGNRATNGGALYSIGKPALNNVTFQGNTAAFQGGAIYNTGEATFDGVTVENNSAQSGGGVYSTGAATISNAMIRDNIATNFGGGIYTSNSAFTVSKTTFTNNSADTQHGGAMYVYSGTQTLNESTFQGNSAEGSGGAVYLRTGILTGDRLTFTGNTAKQHGGGIYNTSAVSVTNSVFSRNSVTNSGSYYGGAIHHASGTLSVTNGTFYRNTIAYTNMAATTYGAAVSRGSGTLNINNSIFWDNLRGGAVADQIAQGAAVKNSLVKGGYQTGTLILDLDPLFANAATDDLSLTTCSPAINMGDNSLNQTVADRSGASRVGAGTVDLGAFENQSVRLILTPGFLPKGRRGTAYSQPLSASGGNGNYTYSVSYGQLPDGLILDASGLLSGTPFVAGTYTFNINVTDGLACGNQLYVMEVEAGSGGVRIYVNQAAVAGRNNGSSWADGYTDLQKALTVSTAGDEIWVAKGTYSPGNLATSWFTLKEGVKLYGGFAATEALLSERDTSKFRTDNQTVLDGSQGVASYHVLYNVLPVTNATVVNGFIVTGGKRPASTGMSPVHYYGGGFYNSGGSPHLENVVFEKNHSSVGSGLYNSGGSPVLSNVLFKDNTATDNGGALYSAGLSTVLTIVNSGFVNNSSVGNGGAMNIISGSVSVTGSYFTGNSTASSGNGGALYSAGPVTVTGSTFDGNTAYYGGAVYSSGAPVITQSTFINNASRGYGGAAYFGGAARLARTEFTGNTAAMHGGAVYFANGGKISNGVFSRNRVTSAASYYGGAVYHAGGSLDVLNSSFSGNQIAFANSNPDVILGAGLASRINTAKITNSIFWGNTRANAVPDQITTGLIVGNSLVQNGYTTGSLILTSDPLFTNAAADDLSLQSCSPAINMGNNSAAAAAALTEDFAGSPRVTDGTVDLGAYENGSTRLSIQTATLPAAVRGEAYSAALSATGGTGTYTYTIDFGKLPDGMSLSSSGILSGKPFAAGTFTFNVTVSDGVMCGSKLFDITVTPGSGGVRIYVNQAAVAGSNNGSDWANGYLTLQRALAVTRPGDSVWVAKGTYSAGNTSTSWFTLQEGVKIYGGFAATEAELSDRDTALLHTDNRTVLGGVSGTQGYHVIYNIAALTSATILDGFTIQGGKAAIAGSYILSPNYIGAGIYNANVTSRPVFRNLIIGNNTAVNGGGMYNTGSPELTNVQFLGNSATFGYGGAFYNTGSPVMTDVVFDGNSSTSRGGAMYNSGSPVLTKVDFINNSAVGNGGAIYTEGGNLAVSRGNFRSNQVTGSYSGGAVYSASGSTTTLRAISFIDNRSVYSGGAFYNAGASVLKNVIFSRNRVTSSGPYYGGGMFTTTGAVSIVNATFSQNTIAYAGTSQPAYGAGLYRNSGTVDVVNSIFWHNTRGGGVQDQVNSGVVISSSIVEGGYTTGTMIADVDPKFTDPVADLSLQACSPAIDAADNSKLGGLSTDLAGQPRVSGLFADLGAFEFQAGGPGLAPEVLPDARQWTQYSEKLSSASAGYTYTLSVGALPDGMTLAPDGTLSGKPSTAGVHTFGLGFTNGSQCGTVKVTLTVTARAPFITSVIAPYAGPVTAHVGKTFGDIGLVSEVDVMLSDGTQTKVTVQWAPGTFNGNVIDNYPIQGTLDVAAEINPSNFLADAVVSVIDPMTKYIETVDTIAPVYVLSGTPFEELILPASVNVTYNTGVSEVLNIQWKPDNYGLSPTRYQLFGELVLTDEFSNPTNKVATVDVYAQQNIISVEAQADKYVALNTPESGLFLPAMVRVTYHDQTTELVLVDWDTSPYLSNPAGVYNLQGELELNATTSNTGGIKAAIRVVVRKNIVSIDPISPLSVPFGTPFEDIDMPDSVRVTYDDGTTGNLALVWNAAGYNPVLEGTYPLAGEIQLADGIVNTSEYEASINVTVLQRPKTVQSVATVAPHSVPFGTDFSAVVPDLPLKVEVTYDDATTDSLLVTWKAGGYNGNLAGPYSLVGDLTLKAGVINPDSVKASVLLNVSRQFLTAVTVSDTVSVPYGTQFNDVTLPYDVAVTYNNGVSGREEVDWLPFGTYNSNQEGVYTFYGDIRTRPEVDNPGGLQGQVSIRVLERPGNILSVTVPAPLPVPYGTPVATLLQQLPDQLTVSLDNGETGTVGVNWNLAAYDAETPGNYVFYGGLILPADITNTDGHTGRADVVVDNRYITAVGALDTVAVAYGTAYPDIAMPLTATVTYSDGTTGSLNLSWDPTGYDGNTAGDYILSGTLDLTPGTDNRQNVIPSVTVQVQAQTFALLSLDPVNITVDYGTAFGDIVKPVSVNGTLDDFSSVPVMVQSWNSAGYQPTVPGTYRITGLLSLPGTITNPSNLVAELFVTVDIKHIVSVTPPASVSVEFNTSFAQLQLPGTVQVTYNDNSTGTASVAWQQGGYEESTPGVYALTGVLTVTDPAASNKLNIQATINVEVQNRKRVLTAVQPVTINVAFGTPFSSLVLPTEMTGYFDDGTQSPIATTWTPGTYNASQASTYILSANMTLPADAVNPNAIPAEVTVIVGRKFVQSVGTPAPVSAPYQTTFGALNLPAQVSVTFNDGSSGSVPVQWESTGYNPDPGTYTLTGNLQLDPDTDNPNDIHPEVVVTVHPEDTRITSVEVLSSVVPVAYGTPLAVVLGNLPPDIGVGYNTGGTARIPVSWAGPTYDPFTPGSYSFTGTLQPESGTTNPSAFVATITVVVDKPVLTITAEHKIRYHGDPNPPLTYTINGFVNGDDESSLSVQPAISTVATVGSQVGDYDIEVSAAAAADYDITFVNGTLRIVPEAPASLPSSGPLSVFQIADFMLLVGEITQTERDGTLNVGFLNSRSHLADKAAPYKVTDWYGYGAPKITPLLVTSGIRNILTTSADAGGHIHFDGGSGVTERGICWSTTPGATVNDNKAVMGAGTGSFNGTVSGLQPGTTYYIRAFATNSEGTAYGNEVQFTTKW